MLSALSIAQAPTQSALRFSRSSTVSRLRDVQLNRLVYAIKDVIYPTPIINLTETSNYEKGERLAKSEELPTFAQNAINTPQRAYDCGDGSQARALHLRITARLTLTGDHPELAVGALVGSGRLTGPSRPAGPSVSDQACHLIGPSAAAELLRPRDRGWFFTSRARMTMRRWSRITGVRTSASMSARIPGLFQPSSAAKYGRHENGRSEKVDLELIGAVPRLTQTNKGPDRCP
jgi:hypothetical protein